VSDIAKLGNRLKKPSFLDFLFEILFCFFNQRSFLWENPFHPNRSKHG
jgi:hypothetical protein